MRIPSKGRYAVSALIDLALHEQDGPLTIAQIAENQKISLSYLEQLFADLRRHGLIKGTRGPGGGYRLAMPAEQISVAKIIASIDESALTIEHEGDSYAPFKMWASLSERLLSFMDDITLADCIKQREGGLKKGKDKQRSGQVAA